MQSYLSEPLGSQAFDALGRIWRACSGLLIEKTMQFAVRIDSIDRWSQVQGTRMYKG
jgi:hypothetical protein